MTPKPQAASKGESGWFAATDLRVGRSGTPVLEGISVSVEPSEVVAIIGPNGAGKSTLLHAISRLLPVQGGSIVFDGRRIERLGPHAVVALGIVQIPEGRHLFSDMTVHDNLLLGAHLRKDGKQIRDDLRSLEERFPILGQRRDQRAGTASGGEQQIIAIARALMARPRLLLLDEPTIGLAPKVVEELADVIRDVIAGYDMGILLVEQNARMALSVSDRAYVMEVGRIALDGDSAQLAGDERVRKAYL